MDPGACEALASQLGGSPAEFRDPIYVVDRSGRIVFCNPAFAGLVGERVEDIVGKLSLLFYPPEAAPVFLLRRVHSLLGHDVPVPRTLTTEIRHSGRDRLPVELSVTSLEVEGSIVGRLAVVRELAASAAQRNREPPAVEELLQLSQEEADRLPYGLIVLDPSGDVTGYNAAESRLSGLAPSEVLGRNFFQEIAPCTRVRAFAGRYRQMAQAGAPDSAQFDFVFRLRHREQRVSIFMAYSPQMKLGTILVETRALPPSRSDDGPH